MATKLSARVLPSTETEGNRYQEIVSSLISFATLSKLLRFIGASIIVCALGIFLVQGWQNGDDIQRYFILLGQTGLLGIIGFLCNRWLQDPKSARLFIGLGLVSVPINFAILGGLIYSQVQWSEVDALYPSFANWQAESLTLALATAAIAITALTPVICVSFMTLARKSAIQMTTMYMISGLALLMPTRFPEVVALTVVVLSAFVFRWVSQIKKSDITLSTFEGRCAVLLQLLPISIIVIREVSIYGVESLLTAGISLSVYLTLRHGALSLSVDSVWRKSLDQISVLPAMGVAVSIASFSATHLAAPPELILPIFGITLFGLLIETSLRSPCYGLVLKRWASIAITLSLLINLTLWTGTLAALFCVIVGVGVLLFGFSYKLRITFISGLITLIAGLCYQFQHIFLQFDFENWLILAALGISTILIASVLERYGAVIRHYISLYIKNYQTWNY